MAQPYVAFTALLYLLGVTRSILPAEQTSTASPRSFAPWDREERDLVCAFQEHGLSIKDMAKILKRTTKAMYQELQKGRIPKSLTRYPRTSIQLCPRDVELLIEHTESSERDPLLWVYGQALPSEFWAAAAAPTFRLIRVAPDPLTAQWRPGPESQLYWEAFRHDASAAAQAVWIDLAAQVTRVGGTVLVPPPDPHHKRVSQVREALRRISRKPAPRGSIRIFDEKFRPSPDKLRAPALLLSLNKWKPSDTAKLPYKTVIAVLPYLAQQDSLPDLDATERTEMAKFTANLPLRVRYDEQFTWQQYASLEHQQGDKFRIAGRHDEPLKFVGLPNTRAQPARLDWVSLNVIPDHGHIITTNQEILVRAVVWFALRHKKWPATNLLPPSFPKEMSASHFYDTYSDEKPLEKLIARLQLDLNGTDLSSDSPLPFSIKSNDETNLPDYIGS